MTQYIEDRKESGLLSRMPQHTGDRKETGHLTHAPQRIEDRRKNGDRRKSPRLAASGVVEITFAAPVPVTIHCALVETSAAGFRAAHDSKALEPGLIVSYRRRGARGDARVIWTHILEGRRVSGFKIIGGAHSLPPAV
jgi:hypothetical protein